MNVILDFDSRADQMTVFHRRQILQGGVAAGVAATLAGCATTPPSLSPVAGQPKPQPPLAALPQVNTLTDSGFQQSYQDIYGPLPGEKFPLAAVKLSDVAPDYRRRFVDYSSPETPGTIVIDPKAHYLYHIQPGGKAMRYGVGVGREGFGWSGVANINSKQEWPDWYPPPEMIARQPEIKRVASKLQSGIGVAGGPRNPLGARAMYLWQNNKDTLFRIHGTVEPWTIGKSVSSGCIRMVNQDVVDLYSRTAVGTKVIVLGASRNILGLPA